MMQNRLFLFSLTFLVVVLAACVPIEKSKTSSESAEYHYTLGVSSLNDQKPTEALKAFLRAENYAARDPRIQAGLAQAYWLKKAHDLAEKHFKNAIEWSGKDPFHYNNLGALYLTMERYDDAIIAFQSAANSLLFEQPELAWTGLGVAYVQKQDYTAAHRAYQKAMEVNPRYAVAPFQAGELYYNQDRPVEALEMFTRAVELAPQFARGYYWQGLTYMKMKETEKAKKAFREVVRLDPQSETAGLAEKYLKIIK